MNNDNNAKGNCKKNKHRVKQREDITIHDQHNNNKSRLPNHNNDNYLELVKENLQINRH